jgi:integrase
LTVCGAAKRSQQQYLYHLNAVVKVASRIADRNIPWSELMRDTSLLGRALDDDVSPTRPGHQLSGWTMAARRAAVRHFIALVRPELENLLNENPDMVLATALRSVAEQVGLGFRLNGGARRRRGGEAPTAVELDHFFACLDRTEHYRSARNQAFFRILAESGTRVNALRSLDGADTCAMPDGSIRLFMRNKRRAEQREVELSPTTAERLRQYISQFNQLAWAYRWSIRIGIGQAGSLWRNSSRGTWPYADVVATLRTACANAGIPMFRPHAFRRAYATDGAAQLPRHTVALAGGWHGMERMDNHYVRPQERATLDRLAKAGSAPASHTRAEDIDA